LSRLVCRKASCLSSDTCCMKVSVLVLLLFLISCAHKTPLSLGPASSSKYGKNTFPLSLRHDFSGTDRNPFWAIVPYYRSQATDSSCSVASATMVLNALIPSYTMARNRPLLTEARSLEISASKDWVKNTREGADGVTLESLAREIKEILPKLNLSGEYESGMVIIRDESDTKKLMESLEKFKNGDGYIILDFNQGVIMGKGSYPHFSPVGAYDQDSQTVLIMDTDGEWYGPYWVEIKWLLKSMNVKDEIHGFIWIHHK